MLADALDTGCSQRVSVPFYNFGNHRLHILRQTEPNYIHVASYQHESSKFRELGKLTMSNIAYPVPASLDVDL